jgi:hypothetical protein
MFNGNSFWKECCITYSQRLRKRTGRQKEAVLHTDDENLLDIHNILCVFERKDAILSGLTQIFKSQSE